MFYDTFKRLCDERGISCNKAATNIGLSNATATKWKKTGATPSGETLSKIATYFNVPIEYLLGNEDNPPAHDILDDVDIAFYGNYKELSEDEKNTVRDLVRVMRERRANK